jgi:hypothetical protein
LKVEALATMGKASEPYASHKQSVDVLKMNVEKAYVYAKGIPKNEDVTEMWVRIKDPSKTRRFSETLGG